MLADCDDDDLLIPATQYEEQHDDETKKHRVTIPCKWSFDFT